MKKRFLYHMSYFPHYFAIVIPIVAVAVMAHDPSQLTLAKFSAMCAVASIMTWRHLRVVKCVDIYFDALTHKDAEPK